jgi:hypothetical protein
VSNLHRTVHDVITFSRGQITKPTQSWDGLCQSHCRQAYGVEAWSDSAIHAWGLTPRKFKVTGRPVTAAPRGALLYYAGGKYGHVAIAAGIKTHDKCLSNDYVRQGKIDYAPRTFPGWGLRYLGYSFWTPFGELQH